MPFMSYEPEADRQLDEPTPQDARILKRAYAAWVHEAAQASQRRALEKLREKEE